MFVKHDYDYNELEKFINKENLQLYYVIRNKNQQDNFVLMLQDYIDDVVTVEELNNFMTEYNYKIQEVLGLI